MGRRGGELVEDPPSNEGKLPGSSGIPTVFSNKVLNDKLKHTPGEGKPTRDYGTANESHWWDEPTD